jgi:hypothetical protein
MSENDVVLGSKKQDYEKPAIKKMGTVSELTMATLDGVNGDSGTGAPFVYS